MNTYYIGDTVYFYFMLHDTDGYSPLSGETVDAFSAYYIIDGIAQSFTLSSANWGEVGSTGIYYLKVTPTLTGSQVLWVQGTNDYYNLWKEYQFTVKAATNGLPIIEKVLTNKLAIETLSGSPSGTYFQVLYDDDGTTQLANWQLYDKDGSDIILLGRGPVTRAAPSGI